MLLRALTPTTGLPPFLAAALPPVSLMVMDSPPLPQHDSQRAQPSTLLLTADPSLLTSCVLLKPLRPTSGLFFPPHNFQNPLCSTLFVKGYLGRFLCVCVCVCVCMCVQPSRTLSIVLFLCKITLGGFWCVRVCVCVCVCACAHSHGTFQTSLYSIL